MEGTCWAFPEQTGPGFCPYDCGSNEFQNSWGRGNAYCPKCKKEFIVSFETGQMTAKKIEETE